MRFLQHTFILIALLSASNLAAAALPVAVDGQALPTLAPMLEKVQKSVVSISSDISQKPSNDGFYDDPFFRRFFDQRRSKRARNRDLAAAGVIVDAENGYILTNEHSIAGASKIAVTFSDGREVPAQLIGVDKVSDVAVIKVEADDLTQISLGDSDAIRVGDFVVSVGDPLGSQSTITSGLISALSKSGSLRNHQNFIQSDAGYGPGILVNLRGDLIGLNISQVAQTAGSTRIGFSTPVNLAMKIKQQIIDFGAPQRGFLAVQVQDLTPELASVFNIASRRGVVVTSVAKDSSADQSGVHVGDVILSEDKQKISRTNDLRTLIGRHFSGDTLDLLVLRNGIETRVQALLESSAKPSSVGTMIHHQLDGATFNEVSVAQGGSTPTNGVLATKVKKGSVAWNNGVRSNDLIISANRRQVSTLDDFRSAISNKDVLMLNIERGDGALFLLLK